MCVYAYNICMSVCMYVYIYMNIYIYICMYIYVLTLLSLYELPLVFLLCLVFDTSSLTLTAAAIGCSVVGTGLRAVSLNCIRG